MPLEREILSESADPQRAQALLEFEAQHHTGQFIKLREQRLRCFFASSPWASSKNRAVTVRSEGAIVGTLNWTEIPVHRPNGNAQLALVHGMRIASNAEAAHVFLHGYSALSELARTSSVEDVFCVVLTDNSAAQRTLVQRPRKSLAPEHVTRCWTYVLRDDPGVEQIPGLRLRRAGVEDIDELLAFLRAQRQYKEHIPRLSAADLLEAEHGPRGLSVSDFYLAYRGTRLCGLAALWNQQGYRQWSIAGYSPVLSVFRGGFNLYARARRQLPLPKAETALPCSYISCLCVAPQEDMQDGAVARALLQRLLSWNRLEGGSAAVLLALDCRDPLTAVFAPRSVWRFQSDVLRLSALRPLCGRGPQRAEVQQAQLQHFEAGLL